MQVGMHTGWQGGRLGCRWGCVQAGRDAYRLAGREARMQVGMRTCRQGCVQAGREGG